ncbi:MAG TPA: hypothetical protein VKB54_21100 [Solirubrobacteraceae bacterium]|nr:hypothetical protein [Solirubrobacteraceae bacterium]
MAANAIQHATFGSLMRFSLSMQTRWRALPTALIVIGAIALGAATARADDAPAHPAAAASTSAAIR